MTVSLPPHRHWDRGGKRPLLALHCSLAHAGAYSGLAAALHGVTLTALDFIGHGKARDWDGVEDYHGAATAEAAATDRKEAAINACFMKTSRDDDSARDSGVWIAFRSQGAKRGPRLRKC